MTIVVLGGGIWKRKPPLFMQKRLNKAIELLKKYPHAKILLCGKYSFRYSENEAPSITEAELMRDYLIKKGIPASKIFLERKSKDTIGNAYYAKKLYFIPKNEKEAIIVTSDFHLNRAKFIFKKIFGPKYRLKFIATPSGFENDKLLKERQKYLLEKTKEFLKEMKEGDHNFLKGKLYKSKFYKEIAPKEIEKFVKTGRL